MIFSRTEGFLSTEGFEKVIYKNYVYYYSGIIYLRGKKAGKESVCWIAEEYETTGIIPFTKIFGAFCLIIDKLDGESIFLSDNSNLHCFFIGGNYIGDNFLEIIRYEKSSEFNMEALCEFFILGGVYFGKTLVAGICLSSNDSYYVSVHDSIKEVTKGIGDIDEPSSINDVSEFFRDMAYSLSDYRLTLSLTGGYDSRMVYACLKDHIPIDVFMSGNNERDPDIISAKKVAQAGGQTLEVIKIEKPKINEEYLRELFQYSQGIAPFVNDGYMRISSFIKNRSLYDYDCYLTGDGGVLHKDWWWVQDLPFYKRKKVNIKRFYDQRIGDIDSSLTFDNKLSVLFETIRDRFITEIEQYIKRLNTQSYDSFYYHINGRKIVVHYSINSKTIASYAPLWELELVRYSYHLPRLQRFFYNSMRKIITENSRLIARVPTIYGTTSSSEPKYLLRDVLFQGVDYGKKAIRLGGRKLLNRSLFIGNLSTWSAENDIRGLDISHEALNYCKRQRFIDPSVTFQSVSYSCLGRIIQIYLLAEYMGHGKQESY